MSEVLTAHRLESILRGDQFANVEVLVILAHDAALRAAFKKAEEERDAQTRRADVTLAKMCDARDAVVARATAAEAKLKKAEEKNKQLRHLLQLATGRTP